MNCCCASIKYILFIFNFIFALGGLALVVVGSILQYNLDYYDTVFGEQFNTASILLIIIGLIVFIISFFGCFGAIRESNCLLYTYVLLLMVAIGGLIAGTVLSFNAAVGAEDYIHDALEKLLGQYGQPSEEGQAATETWDSLQKWLECCGVDGPQDWTIPGIPDSCKCKENTAEERCDALGQNYKYGCGEAVFDFFTLMEYILGGTSIGFTLVAAAVILITCMLSGANKKGHTV